MHSAFNYATVRRSSELGSAIRLGGSSVAPRLARGAPGMTKTDTTLLCRGPGARPPPGAGSGGLVPAWCSRTYDHVEERAWRHLDSCGFSTHLHARPPRVECPEHGVRQVTLPWAEPMSRFTILFERLAIDVLKECDLEGAARLL